MAAMEKFEAKKLELGPAVSGTLPQPLAPMSIEYGSYDVLKHDRRWLALQKFTY
jgi:hypothetical protein